MTDPSSICPNCSNEDRDGLLCVECTRRLMGCLRMVQAIEKKPLPAPKWGKLPGNKNMPIRELWPPGTIGRRQRFPWETSTEGWTGLSEQLEVSYTRQGQRGSGVGAGKSADVAVPFDQGASEAMDNLRKVLTTWVRDLWYEGEKLPRNTLPAISQWLMNRKARIRGSVDAKRIWHDIVGAVEWARRVIDARPTFNFVGPCPICGQGDIYAMADAETGVCRHCTEVVPGIPDMRRRNDAAMKALLVDRADLRRQVLPGLTDVYGLTVKDGTVAKWIQRGTLPARGYRIALDDPYARTDPEPLYWVEEVLDLAAALRGRMANTEVPETKPVAPEPVSTKRRRIRRRHAAV